MDEEKNDFDDLFEPFELDEVPPPGELPPAPEPPPQPEPMPEQPSGQMATLVCTSCGATNPASNRHCEQCGARLGSAPLPVAPPPLARSTPGGRALAVLVGVVLVVAVVVLFINLRGDDTTEPTVAASTTQAPPTTVAFQELKPTSVDASSELTGFEAANLIDDDPETYWNDQSQRGIAAVLTFRFAQPVAITSIELLNLQDDDRFRRNYRIRGYNVQVDDLAIDISGQLEDTNEPQRIRIASVDTNTLIIEVISTFPAEAVDGNPPFSELALGAVRFFGTPAG